jgi:peptide deformylase
MVLKIVEYPDPVLGKKAQPVEEINETIHRLIDDMIETMHEAPGIGLAAPQVGESKQVMVVDIRAIEPESEIIVLINPQIVEADGEAVREEGCLSVPGLLSDIKRHDKVKVRGLNREGKAVEIMGEGLLARVFQHEIDHLNGTVILDRVSLLKRQLYKQRVRKRMRKDRGNR